MDQVRDNINKFIEKIAEKYNFEGLNILEVGVGTLDHNRNLFSKENTYTTSDVVLTSYTNIVDDITNSSFDDNSFDFVIISEVLEHVYDFRSAFNNLRRITKKDGYLLITVPFEYPEHGVDYWRYTSRTLDLLLKEHGFETIEDDKGYDGDKCTNIFKFAKASH